MSGRGLAGVIAELESLFPLFVRANVDVAGSQGQFVQQSGEMRNLTLLET